MRTTQSPRPQRPRPEAFFVERRPSLLPKEQSKQITYKDVCEGDKKPMSLIENHPLANSAGSLRNSIFWDEMMDSIRKNRLGAETEDNTAE